jgi:hypothetical protein
VRRRDHRRLRPDVYRYASVLIAMEAANVAAQTQFITAEGGSVTTVVSKPV